MKILVTGSSGLVGRELVARLRHMGHEPVAFDLMPVDGAFARDIRDPEALTAALSGCDGVYHLAAVSRVAWGEQDPATCHSINVAATQLLVERMRDAGKPWLVFASSREVYGDPASARVTEGDPIAPVNAYGRSKAEAEIVIGGARSDGFRTAIVRLSNVYGTLNDHPDRAVPALLWRAINDAPIELTGGENYFDFVHVDDSVDGLIAAGEAVAAGASPPAVHLATGQPTSLATLARTAIELCGSRSDVKILPARSFDVSGFCGDPAQANALYGWRAKVALPEGMVRLRQLMLEERRPMANVVMPGPDVVRHGG